MSSADGTDSQVLALAAAGYDAENDSDEHTVDLGSLGDLLSASDDDVSPLTHSSNRKRNNYEQEQRDHRLYC